MANNPLHQISYLDHPHLIRSQMLYLEQNPHLPKGDLWLLEHSEGTYIDIQKKAEKLGITIHKVPAQKWKSWSQKQGFSLTQEEKILYQNPVFPIQVIRDSDLIHHTPLKPGLQGVILDEIQDPQNFGAILRSAAFYGIPVCIIGTHRQAPLSPTVARISAGGIFGIEILVVKNLQRAIQTLKKEGFWLVGTALKNPQAKPNPDHSQPLLCIMGNEHRGLRPSIQSECDYNLEIPSNSMYLDSLNVASASSIIFDRIVARSSM